MAIPPPPGPPRPPPPPAMGGLKLGIGGGSGGGIPSTDARSALLQSIQKGTKLKKTVTVDKSAPVATGKIIGDTKSSSPPRRINNSINNTSTLSSSTSSSQHIANGGPKLAGLFEGMTSMPKLKPVNGRENVPSSRSTTKTNIAQDIKEIKSNIVNNSSNNINTNINNNNNNNNGPMDFNTELTKHLAQTLKRQKQQQQQQPQIVNATEANLRTNRGPPPKPPIQKNIITSSTSDSLLEKSSNTTTSSSKSSSSFGGKASSPTLSEGSNSSTVSNNSMKKNSNFSLSIGNSNVNSGNSSRPQQPPPITSTTATTTTMHTPLAYNLIPNKSTLFGTNSSNNTNSFNTTNISQNYPSSSLSTTNTTTSTSLLSSSSSSSLLSTTSSSSSKPIINHGKPNCAPKPPGIQQLVTNSGKPTVSRHHSMKSPRSPPISTLGGSGGSIFSTAQHFGTLRGPPQQFNQSQESISLSTTTTVMRQAPIPPLGRPTEAPPKPPSLKPAPPPVPARSVSNTNLTNLPLSTASSGTSFGSTNNVNNVTAIKEQLKSQISYTGSAINVSTIKSSSNQLSTIGGGSGSGGGLGVSNLAGSTGKLSSPIHNRGDNKGTNLNGISPPIPSHRTHPAPEPPRRHIMSSTSHIAPVPPRRDSSIRSNSATGTIGTDTGNVTNLGKMGYSGSSQQQQHQTGSGNICSGNSGIVNRLIIDIEAKYGSRFHNVTEFPAPQPFLNIQKSYPSRSVNNAEIRKPRAPCPPSINRHQQGYNIDQLNEQNT